MSFLESSILVETSAKNKYVFDRQAKKLVICSPILFFILSLVKQGIDVQEWMASQKNDNVTLEDGIEISIKQIEYYYKKYLLLKDNGFFSTVEQNPFLNHTITPEEIKTSLANTRLLTLEATDSCNLTCAYCGYGKFYNNYDKRENKFMEPEMAFIIIDYLVSLWNSPLNRSHNLPVFVGFYGGEALLAGDFLKKVVSYIKSKTLKYNTIQFSMTTNGLLLKKHINFLIENNFNLMISLDGNEINNSYRVFKDGENSFNTVYHNLKFLQENYPDYFDEHVTFNAVLHNRNSVSEVFHFFKKEFNKFPSIGALNDSGIAESQQKDFWQTYKNPTQSLYSCNDYSFIEEEMFIQLPNIQRVAGFLHHITDFSFTNYNDLFRTPTNKQSRLPSGTCFPFSKKVFLTVNGKILACEKIGHKFELGRVERGEVSLNFEDIAEQYNSWFAKISKKCKNCYNIEQCTQCMFYLNLENDVPNCQGFMTYEDFAKRLASMIDYIEKRPDFYSKIFKHVRFG